MADKLSRRTALSIIGGSAAVITGESFAQPIGDSEGKETRFRFAISKQTSAALRRLADDIDAKGTLVQSMELTSKAHPEDFLTHKLTIEFVLDEDGNRKPIS